VVTIDPPREPDQAPHGSIRLVGEAGAGKAGDVGACREMIEGRGHVAHAIRVGVGGWSFDPWDETFYPAGLSKAKQLNHIESDADRR